jgi:hypothetical protein
VVLVEAAAVLILEESLQEQHQEHQDKVTREV